MRFLVVALLVASTAGLNCDFCGNWSGAFKPNAMLGMDCKDGDGKEIEGDFKTVEACKAAGGTTSTATTCGMIDDMAKVSPQYCQSAYLYGSVCCGGDFSGTLTCDVCKDFSGSLQRDKSFHKRCLRQNGAEIDGEYPDLAACQSAGGTSLQEMKCDYMLHIGMSPEFADPQKCKSISTPYGARCCGGNFTGTLACDVCEPPSGLTCMYRTPSGCPEAPQYASTSWSIAPDPSTNTSVACASMATEGNTACGVTDIETKWATIEPTEKKCLDLDKVIHKECRKGDQEVEGDFEDLAACKAAGGTFLIDRKCDYMLHIGNSPGIECSTHRAMAGSRCCTATCPTPATAEANNAETQHVAMALSFLLLQMWF